MGEWREVTLGEVLTLQRGFDLPARDREDGPVPVVSSSGVTGRHSVAKVGPPGVVIGRYGSLGSVHWIEEPFWPLNTALWVKDFKGNDPRYIGYLLKTMQLDGGSASAVPGVNRNQLHQLPVRIPSRYGQQKIAAVLAAFDELVLINKRRAEVLAKSARSVYSHWFGARVRETPAPEGWEWAELGSMAKWLSGGTPDTGNQEYWGGDVPWITSGTLKHLVLRDSARKLTVKGARAGTRTVERDALLVVVRGMSLVREFRVGIADCELAFGQDCKALVAVEGIDPLFLAFAVLDRQADIQKMVELAGHGTGKLSTDRLKRIKVLTPPWEVQRRFSDVVRPVRELLSSLSTLEERLAATRDLLLPRLVNGRLDISDVDLGTLTPDKATA